MEERKLKEIEHSKIRRNILQGFERLSDSSINNRDGVEFNQIISDKKAFNRHFSNMKYYSITRASEAFKTEWLKSKCKPGKLFLDYACGSGENAIHVAQLGSDVIGIDISPEGINNARKNSELCSVAETCKFVVMDGENMNFDDNTFDYGIEYGALHHVDLDSAMKELARVLKPEAEMICIEAMRHNPLIHAYRKITPHLRTAWEVDHILGIESLSIIKKYFNSCEVRFFHLFALLAVPFRKTKIFKQLLVKLDYLDHCLLRKPNLGKYGWLMIISIARPKK